MLVWNDTKSWYGMIGMILNVGRSDTKCWYGGVLNVGMEWY